jgi:prepilin-type N-terminal cleavage/methylation domain-containing protein
MKNKAFTLIELLVVVLIIGILAAIALPKYEVAVEKSRAAEAVINMNHVLKAWDLQHLSDPTYSATFKAQDIMELSGGVWSSDGNKYCTKNFYHELAYGGRASISRCTPKADCSACSGTKEYSIKRTPSWATDRADCYWVTSLGKQVCNSVFKGYGYTVMED